MRQGDGYWNGLKGQIPRGFSWDEKPKQAAAGRPCAEDGCITKISIYNRAKKCWLHSPDEVPRGRRRARA